MLVVVVFTFSLLLALYWHGYSTSFNLKTYSVTWHTRRHSTPILDVALAPSIAFFIIPSHPFQLLFYVYCIIFTMKSLSQNHIPRSLTSLRARQPNDFSCNQNKHHRQQLQIQQNPNGLVNTSNISSGSNNLIQSNSIQNQFTALSNQKEAFVSENNLAKKELQQIQKEHQSVNMEHDHLIELGRQAKERLGQGMEKLGILKEQEARILQLTKNEFRAIHDCTNHSNLVSVQKMKLESNATIKNISLLGSYQLPIARSWSNHSPATFLPEISTSIYDTMVCDTMPHGRILSWTESNKRPQKSTLVKWTL